MGDLRTTMGEKPPVTPGERRLRRRLTLLLLLAGVCLALLAGTAITVERHVLANGYVTTEQYAEVRPAGTGMVAEIVVTSGAMVEKGELLVRLDSAEEQAALSEAHSRVSQLEAEMARRQAEIAEQKRRLAEDVAKATLHMQNASTKLVRTQELLARGLVAGSALEDDKLTEELARAELNSLMSRDQGIFDKELAVLRQELEGRRETVSRAEARVRVKEIRAPIAGQVLRYEFVIGELVRPETVLYEIFGGSKQVLKLRIAERYATRVAAGQRYEAALASYRGLPRVTFTGTVEHLRNVIQADGQQTYRVATCSFDAAGRHVPPGTSAEAKIFYGESRLWLALFGLD